MGLRQNITIIIVFFGVISFIRIKPNNVALNVLVDCKFALHVRGDGKLEKSSQNTIEENLSLSISSFTKDLF